jgi:hypothetical protein
VRKNGHTHPRQLVVRRNQKKPAGFEEFASAVAFGGSICIIFAILRRDGCGTPQAG